MAVVPWTKVLVVPYPRTGQQDRNQGAERILSGGPAARTDVYGKGADERRSRPAMRDWQRRDWNRHHRMKLHRDRSHGALKAKYYNPGITLPILFDIGFLPTYN